jgi:predicted hotdog family 3-hydroxylacyl-ACP dehydratase
MMPPPATLTAHQPPALVVDGLLAADGFTARARLRAGPADLLRLTEGCAQTVAVLMGWAGRSAGAGPARGMLVGVREAVLEGDPGPGPFTVAVERLHELAPFSVFAARVERPDGSVAARVELKTMGLPAQATP